MLFSTLLLLVLWYLLLSYGTRFWQAYVNSLMEGGGGVRSTWVFIYVARSNWLSLEYYIRQRAAEPP
jgi:hypothetical protein